MKIKSHLSHKEIDERYRKCKSTVEKPRWNLIRLMTKPNNAMLVVEAAKAVGFCQRWARHLVHRYNKEGASGLLDKRQDNKGHEPCLTDKQAAKLRNALIKETPPDKGLWTGPKVVSWIENETGIRPSSKVTGWNYLQKLGFTLQQPRPKNIKSATPKEIDEFKKN